MKERPVDLERSVADRGQTFKSFFETATGTTPYPYQAVLGKNPIESRLINIPTGCGKTAPRKRLCRRRRSSNACRNAVAVLYFKTPLSTFLNKPQSDAQRVPPPFCI